MRLVDRQAEPAYLNQVIANRQHCGPGRFVMVCQVTVAFARQWVTYCGFLRRIDGAEIGKPRTRC